MHFSRNGDIIFDNFGYFAAISNKYFSTAN